MIFIKISALKFSFLLILSCLALVSFAQEKYTLSGYVKDNATGEDMFGVNVFVEELLKGAATNMYGFYSLTLPEGTYKIKYSYLGYKSKTMEVVLKENIQLDINLAENAVQAEEIVITGKKKDKNVESVQISVVELETQTVKEIPNLLGEADIFRTLQLMPGVMSAGEGNSGLYVRGGGPDQNLVLLDNATVYNPGHLLGFFSVFNADAIKSTTLIKGGIPAEYGGRISSVLDIGMREGNMKEYEVEGGIGLISSRLTVQGPFKKDRSAFIVSARTTYINFLLNPVFKNKENPISIPYFFDINAKMNFRLSDKDRVYFSGYFGRDKFSFNSSGDSGFSFEVPWGNATATMRWNHQFNDKMFMNNTFVFNDYTSKVSSTFQETEFNLNSGIRDFGVKGQLEIYPKVTNTIKAGYEYLYHTFTPYIYEFQSGDDVFTSTVDKRYGHEFAVYVQDEVDITDWLKINAGLRLSMFGNVGPTNRIYFNDALQPVDTVYKPAGQAFATYYGAEPRINARFKIDSKSSVKMGLNYNKQYIHLVSNSTTTLPFDLWVPSTDVVKPQSGVQASAGYFRNFKDNMYETSIEGYYKRLWNQVEFSNDVVSSANQEVEDQFTFGNGHAYGAEFFVKKNYGKFNGWVGYTLAWTNRRFEDINEGNLFPAKFDRRHDLSVVLIYEINKRWKLSSTFVYGSGQNTTIPVNAYVIDGNIINEYGERNGYRLPAYHRLDIGAVYVLKDNKKRYSELNFSIYNLYSRANPYFIYNDFSGDIAQGNLEIQAKQVSLFPIIPTITWNFRY